jgi:two-component system, NarL family, response regulator LiaR
MPKLFLKKHRSIWVYGLVLALLMFLLKWMELQWLIFDNARDVYMGAIALLFTLLGLWLARHLFKPKIEKVIEEKTIYINRPSEFSIDQKALALTGLSNREMEVLQLLAKGYSNKAIAEQLYVSLNTIKTHCSNIFEKLEVKSRLQAIEKAKNLHLIL